MPEISVRGLEMPESPIRKLAPLAAAAKKRGTKVYHLNIGQPDLPTPQVGLDALKQIDRKILEYSPSQGYLSYREKLVDYYAKYNINVTADDIIITSGGSEAVLFAFLSCLNPGDEIIVPEPAYANYMAFAISAGAKIRTIATTIDEGFSLPKVEKFEELINDRTRAIMICNPNNPTGYLYTCSATRCTASTSIRGRPISPPATWKASSRTSSSSTPSPSAIPSAASAWEP